jgi:hypothetical protein
MVETASLPSTEAEQEPRHTFKAAGHPAVPA